MDEGNGEILEVLKDIQETLNRIYVCFEDQYSIIQKKRGTIKLFNEVMTDSRKKIFPLLFDENHLSYSKIGELAGVTKQSVSQFVNLLIDKGFITRTEEDGKTILHDIYDLGKTIV